MQSIRILAIGKKHEKWAVDAIERYQQRLKKPFDVEWVLLPHSSRQALEARQEESERLLSRTAESDYIVLLDEAGVMLDSVALSNTLLQPLQRSKSVVIIIGGAYGVDQTIHARANFIWSLSRLVFPHQLVRILLIEQLYRSQEIVGGGPYHHA